MSTTAQIPVTLQGVSRHFSLPGGATVRALDDVTLAIAGGAAVALAGPSGSGKSTLLYCVGGIEAVDSGQIVVGDEEITGLSAKRLTAYRRRIGLVFQRSNLLPALTALDNVMAPVLPYRTDFDKREVPGASSRRSASKGAKRRCRPACPAASSSESRSPGRSSTTRGSSSPTNPPAPSTRRRARRSSTCCWICGIAVASR
jgi:putative ABC transport system ATP-binding protein